ncbi:FeoA family protein [Caldanaerobacter subterraneus]|uniref:Ferrous iron transport protein A n=1 Tax=Caldanaerobacter subterraneus TaxID=911092 RepID=A0A7Y2L775_9THEO|nr:FeoA family protein [Caldanaerobacter subterraneus]NNG67062.1 ferrous iron transport protein A [Caldanaerobacter subterraneus]
MLKKGGIVLPLSMLPPGKKAVVVDMIGGEGIRRRLIDMGIVRGVEILVVKNDVGPLIVRVGEMRFALGFGMAQKILVEEL